MKLIKPWAILLHMSAVPAEIEVIGYRIRNLDNGIGDFAGSKIRHSGQPGLVHFMHQLIQALVVFQKICILTLNHGDLIGKTPYHDAGVVIALDNQLLHLLHRILVSGAHMP